jgi:hypothetical protein
MISALDVAAEQLLAPPPCYHLARRTRGNAAQLPTVTPLADLQ